MCRAWLSLTRGDGRVERILPVAGEENLRDKGRLFDAWTRHKFFDDVSFPFTNVTFHLCKCPTVTYVTVRTAIYKLAH